MNCFAFGKERRLLTLQDFGHLRKGARTLSSPYLMAYYRKTRLEISHTRMGLSISKKVGNAVIRNQIKRQLREEFRLSPYREGGQDILFVVSPRFKSLLLKDKKCMVQLRRKLSSLLKKTCEM